MQKPVEKIVGRHRHCLLVLATLGSLFSLAFAGAAFAAITGPCSECHTMHNSQNNQPMTFNSSATPNDTLLKATCYGCHAQGGASALVTVGVDTIPQVFHTDTIDLAAGNFAYITGLKGSGASDSKGHNISDLTGIDNTLSVPPGLIDGNHPPITTSELSCAGDYGCHGNRQSFDPDYQGIRGAHHTNLGGSLDPAATDKDAGHSYRFLVGVKGYEDPDWQYTKSATDHNEYFGRSTPIQLGCSTTSCHGYGGVRPPDGTMSQFCATCHGNFHTLATPSSNGIGPDAISPFIRHPTDLSLPATGEYAAYTTYNVNVPIARITVPTAPSGTVTPGSDAVMCLSCHFAHAGNYPEMLRWDYTTMIAGGGGSGGCFVCHSTKN
ncbi:hypothetical protein MNBD_DELTA04-1467 [hydrothermal vent metagenome]|uniref:Doubled CXXCH motif domain-containing protein n=1 Tax=hydrothermal vent metagenome TaxID=652676 RepID=A0A3B0VSA7_9ZZZZ